MVQRIEVQARRAALQQAFAHFSDDLLAIRLNALDVVTIRFQLLAYPAWNLGATGVGETCQLAVVGDRHDARHDWQVDTHLAHAVDKVEVAVGVEEILGNRTVGTGFGLAHEVGDIVFEIACLWMHLRVGGDFDVKLIASLFTNEAHQLVGIAQLAAGHAHAGWQVATQGNDALDACVFVEGQQLAQLSLAVANARKVRSGFYFDLAVELQHGVQCAVAGRAACAIGAGEEIWAIGGQLAGSCQQLFVAGFGLGREELEAVTAFFTHQKIPS